MNSENKWEQNISDIYARHAKTVWRVCYSFMHNSDDTEDMLQETFLKMISLRKIFVDEDHERKWLIVTATNICKDVLKSKGYYHENVDDHPELYSDCLHPDSLREAVAMLPDNYKTIIYMYYYEGYKTKEIAHILDVPHATVRTRLRAARKCLKKLMEE